MSWSASIPVTPVADFADAMDAVWPANVERDTDAAGQVEALKEAATTLVAECVVGNEKVCGSLSGHAGYTPEGARPSVSLTLYGVRNEQPAEPPAATDTPAATEQAAEQAVPEGAQEPAPDAPLAV